jgi:hypothetical protein
MRYARINILTNCESPLGDVSRKAYSVAQRRVTAAHPETGDHDLERRFEEGPYRRGDRGRESER